MGNNTKGTIKLLFFSLLLFQLCDRKVVYLDIFASLFVLVLYNGSWLLSSIALPVIIAFPTISTVIAVAFSWSSRQWQKVYLNNLLTPLIARKSTNHCYCDTWKSNNNRKSN